MENLLNIFTAIIAVYGAVLSTYLAIRQFRSEKPRLVFTHRFIDHNTGKCLEIITTNLSSKSINLVEGYYLVGASSAQRNFLGNEVFSVAPSKSVSFLVPLNSELKHLAKVDEFYFVSSTGVKFTHNLGRSIEDEFNLDGFLKNSPQIFFELEKINASFDKAVSEIDNSMSKDTLIYSS